MISFIVKSTGPINPGPEGNIIANIELECDIKISSIEKSKKIFLNTI